MSGTNSTTRGLRSITRVVTPVRLRLAGLVLVVSLGLLVVTWIKTGTWRRLEQLQQEFATVQTESFYFGNYLRSGVSRMNSAVLRFKISGDAAERELFNKEAAELQERMRQMKPSFPRQEHAQFRQAESSLRAYLRATAPLLKEPLPVINREQCAQLTQDLTALAQPLMDLGNQLVEAQQTALGSVFAASRLTIQSLQNLIQLSLLLLVILVVATAGVMYRLMVTPLRAQLTATQALMERQEKLASLGTLATGVAHEIRNPLTAIKFRLFSLRKSLPAAMKDNDDVQVINNEIMRLEKIVKDFLQFARPTAPTLVTVPVRQVVANVENLLAPQLEKSGIILRVETIDPGRLKADPQQLQQVLINLIQNAAESMEDGGQITVRAKAGMAKINQQSTPVLTIQVADTGKGMAPDIQKRIFDPFFSTKENGTGLGLPIAARIVERHGGFLEFESYPNRGTTFTVVLPGFSHDVNANTAH